MVGGGFEELTEETHAEVRALILAGLADHWGVIDESLNSDLADLLDSYRDGRTVVLRGADGVIIGTGTIIARGDGVAEIVRMSVASTARRGGFGRRIVDELMDTARRWGIERVVLETTSTWTDVIDFYLANGFVITHVAPSEFGDDTWFERPVSQLQTGRGGD